MSLKQTILKGVIYTNGGIALNSLTFLLTSIYTFRIVAPREYGVVGLCMSLGLFGDYLINLGLSPVFGSEMAKKRGDGNLPGVKYYFNALLKLQTVSTLALALILIALRRPAAGFIHVPPDYLYAVALYILFYSANVFYTTFFNAFLLYFWQNALGMLAGVFRFALVAAVYFAKPEDPVFWLLWTFPASMAGAVLVATPPMAAHTARVFRGVTAHGSADMRASLRAQVKVGAFQHPLKSVVDIAPPWILKFFTNNEAVGIYYASMQLIRGLYMFMRGMETTLLPLISQYHAQDKNKRREIMERMSKYTLWMTLIASVAACAALPWLVTWLVKLEYLKAIPYFRVSLLLLIPLVYMQVQRPLLYAMERQDALVITDILMIAVLAAGSLTVVPWFGLWGMIAVNIANKALTVVAYRQFIRQREPDYNLGGNPFRVDATDRKYIKTLLTLGRK